MLLLLLLPFALGAEVMSFRSDFPDPQLRGRSFEVSPSDYLEAARLRSAIYSKNAEIDAYMRSVQTSQKNWKEQAEGWNQLRKEQWFLIRDLRSIVSK